LGTGAGWMNLLDYIALTYGTCHAITWLCLAPEQGSVCESNPVRCLGFKNHRRVPGQIGKL
jgi:hypothetical protein